MSTGKLIITAKGADAKLINRLLLHVRDWEFGHEDSWDMHRILRTKDEASAGELPLDAPPVIESLENQWEGLSLEEVEKLMLLKDDGKGSTSLFLVLDDNGRQDQTLIVAHRALNLDGDTFWLPEYNKVRVPWQEVHGMWVNLDIANMDFEAFCDDEIGAGENRWWAYRPVVGEDHYVEFAKKRDSAIKELEKLDLA
ncbi:hypothetical protein SUNI508_00796 [Seiridium unicorne]|uniref:DUF6924 domain-containing protein n=1 Tax=Seiridium unicorne TaxID=138068 RepID=A0ABR2V2K9_9PEZI